MKLFSSLSSSQIPTRGPVLSSRTAIADIPPKLFEIFERLENRNTRLHSLAVALGGNYDVPTPDFPDAPVNICERVFYDIENILFALNEMDDHLARLEHLYGIDPVSQLATPEPPEPSLQQTLDDALSPTSP